MKEVDDLVAIVKQLRSKHGCPWDKEQTHQSLRTYLLEETYETLEAIDALNTQSPNSINHFKSELGDLLFQILFHTQIAEENNNFSLRDVAINLKEKLIQRHPHVFGNETVSSKSEVSQKWDERKNQNKDSVLDGIPPLPSLQKSLKIIEKVSHQGFQWKDLEGPWEKLHEELGELEEEIKKISNLKSIHREMEISEKQKNRIENELGDLLFSIANIAYFFKINPEDSLRSMLLRFEQRFRYIEKKVKDSRRKMNEIPLEDLDLFWKEAKEKLNT